MYEKAQHEEKHRFQVLLADLCSGEYLGMRKMNAPCVARRCIGVEDELRAGRKLRFLACESSDAQFGSLEIGEDTDWAPELRFDTADRCMQRLERSLRRMAHVDAEDISAGKKQALDLIRLVALHRGRSLRAATGVDSRQGERRRFSMGRLIRLDRSGHTTLAEWSSGESGEEAAVEMKPRLVMSDPEAMCRCALMGFGVALVGMPHALPHLESGRLVRVLPGWCTPVGRLSIYFASKTLLPAKTRAFVDFIAERFKRDKLAERFSAF